MIILLQSESSQTFKFIPRTLEATSMVITDEVTNTDATITITPIVDRYYLSVSILLSLIEGRSYTISVLNGLDEVYRYKIFCTNQTIPEYSINNGEYVQNTTDDSYVIMP